MVYHQGDSVFDSMRSLADTIEKTDSWAAGCLREWADGYEEAIRQLGVLQELRADRAAWQADRNERMPYLIRVTEALEKIARVKNE